MISGFLSTIINMILTIMGILSLHMPKTMILTSGNEKQVYGRGHRKLTSWKLSQCKPMRLIAYDIFRCIKSTKIYSSKYDIAGYVHLIQLQSSVRSSACYPGGWNHLFSLSAGWSIEFLCRNKRWNLCLAEWQSIIFAIVRYFPQGIV